jgi:hypothetical protein
MGILGLFTTITGLALWLGSVVFVTFFVNPVLARRLTPGKLVEVSDQISARLYWLGMGCGILMLVGGVANLVETRSVPTITFLVLTGIGMGIFLYAGSVILPRAVNLRHRLQSSAGSQENFQLREACDQAERLSTFFNYLVLFLLLGAGAALAMLLGPPSG